MPARSTVAALLLTLSTACAPTPLVRLDTGQGAPLEYRPPPSTESTKVGANEFEKALRQWVLDLPLSIRAGQRGELIRAAYPGSQTDVRHQHLISKSAGGLCGPGQPREHCLSLLDDVMGLSEWDKLGMGVTLSLDPLRESISRAVQDTLAPQLVYTLIATGFTTWVLLAANPEPVFTKAAATLSALLLIYLGVETFLDVVDAVRELKRATDGASTLIGLARAGHEFANRIGPEVARVIVLAITVVVSQGMTGGASLLAARMFTLPGLLQPELAAATRAGISLANIEQVRTVAVVGRSVIISCPPRRSR